ncbi:unnamed protein product [Spirodela intermedia]|uniref:Nuclear transcription factor Y subunit n=1 Tax=Spirodela intermedia TaxID=51605 RepID=A0A7I8KNV3_SPIIN|nr:unnamed protein product [Spirodela intermedia]
MRQESLNRSTMEADEHAARSAAVCSQPWWRGAGYDASPGLGLDIASKSPSLDGLEVREKGGGSQPQQGSGVGEAEGHSKINQDRAAQEGPDGYYGKEQHPQPVASAVPPVAAEFLVPHAQLELGHSIACAPYMYPETYYNGLLGTYGPQPLVNSQLLGMPHTRVLLPLEMAEEPVYVNAKQYHGILRRRQSRAKAELENKLIKVRKPYLHESRHQHAMRRARGCGGRFLNTKKADPSCKTGSSSDQARSPPQASVSESLPADYSGDRGAHELKAHMVQGICDGSYQSHAGFHLSAFHSISDERAEDGDCSGQQRSGMAVNQAPKRVLTI